MHPIFRAWIGGSGIIVFAAVIAANIPAAAAPGPEALPPPTPALDSQTTPRLGLRFFARREGLMAIAEGLTARFDRDRVDLHFGGSEPVPALAIRFADMRRDGMPEPGPVGEAREPGRGNFLLGDPDTWDTDVPIYSAVRYRQIYPGVDLVYSGEHDQLKADWIVRPGADARRIRWSYPGARRVRLQEDGALRVETEGGALTEARPVAYQMAGGLRREVEARFVVERNQVSFALGVYDTSHELIIDPALSYSTYIGGTRNEAATGIALNGTGSVYVAGYTESTNTPTWTSFQNHGGSVDAYVFRFDATGTTLVFATFIGGSGDDRAYGIDVDPTGAAYVTGTTTSTNFPKLAPLQTSIAGVRDAFLLKLNAAGNALVYSTYFGGSGTDIAWGIDVDDYNQVYVAGETTSTNFPTRFPYQSVNRGGYDAFVFKLNASGALVFSTYIGGAQNDGARGVAISNNQLTPYLTGYTWSADFPVSSPSQASTGGGQDAFVVRFNGDANGLVYSTYLGGSGGSADLPEMGLAISVDPFNNVYVAGTTSSLNFPVFDAYQPTHGGGGQDAWLRKLSSGGALMFSTYLGGAGIDVATAVRVDANRRAYVAGYTSSSNFPRLGATQAALGGSYDAFVTEFESTGLTLIYSTTIGGTGSDMAGGVAADSANGDTYVAGSTSSIDFPIQAPYRFTNSGALDIFVAKLTPGAVPPTPPAFLGVTPNVGSGASVSFVTQAADANGANTMDSIQMLLSPTFTGLSSCHLAYVPATNLFYLLNNNATAWLGGLPAGNPAVVQNGQCALNMATAQVVKIGNMITLQWPITFKTGYAGTKFIYLMSVDTSGLRANWASYGIWTSP